MIYQTSIMELHNFLISFIALILWFFIKPYLHRRSSNLPPGPTGLPIIGSLHLLGSHPNQSLAKLAKLHGPLFTLSLGSVTTIVASSPETAKEILQKQEKIFSARTVPDVITAQPNPQATLAWVPGDHLWRNRRRICSTRMFTNQRLDSLQELRHRKVEHMVSHIKKHCSGTGAGEAVGIGRLAFGTTLNLISNTIFSVDMVDPEFETAQEFNDLVWRTMEDGGKPNLSDFFPALRRLDLQGTKRHIRPAYERLHEIFEETIEKRVKERSKGMERKGDFLDVLLDQCEEDGSGFDRQTIKPLIVDLFIAGSDTSAMTTEWGMAELLRNPEILRKVREEILEAIGKASPVRESDFEKLPYLQAVVKETMRLHPAAPLLLPYRAENDTVMFGYTVPKNSQVLVNAWAIGRDPQYWDNPSEFRPERFLGSDLDYKGRDFEYIPFGAGRRICPGMPLAIRMVNLMLASIIQSFTWRLPEGTTPEKLDMEELFGLTLRKAVPLLAIPSME
nr:geraniol 8-hydroxylase-like [Ipomoea trifida]